MLTRINSSTYKTLFIKTLDRPHVLHSSSKPLLYYSNIYLNIGSILPQDPDIIGDETESTFIRL